MELVPDLILYNGSVCTLDEKCPAATAVAVSGNRICALGNDREILALAGPLTRTRNLETRLLMPGFFDTHFHFYEWALNC
ncbi:MAG: amidohydrolase, partial [Proteobacteria bacterium]|nr:amidohydrolase [Pseudomonadota bacterium]